MKGFKKAMSVMLILAVCFVTLPTMATEAEAKTSGTTESTMTSQAETTTGEITTEQMCCYGWPEPPDTRLLFIYNMITIGVGIAIGIGIAQSQ